MVVRLLFSGIGLITASHGRHRWWRALRRRKYTRHCLDCHLGRNWDKLYRTFHLIELYQAYLYQSAVRLMSSQAEPRNGPAYPLKPQSKSRHRASLCKQVCTWKDPAREHSVEPRLKLKTWSSELGDDSQPEIQAPPGCWMTPLRLSKLGLCQCSRVRARKRLNSHHCIS